MYFEKERADEIYASYSSWVGKEAYSGEGKMDVLKAIVVKPKRKYIPSSVNLFKVEFHFNSGRKLLPQEFFAYNGITVSRQQNPDADNFNIGGFQSSPSW